MDKVDYQIKEALDLLFQMPEWEALIKVEADLRESAILRLISVPIEDPNRATTTAYWKGRIDAILDLWKTRSLIRKRKGEKDANNETQEED